MKKFRSRETGITMGMVIAWYLVGLVAGTLFANLTYPYRGGEAEMLGIYVMEQLKEKHLPSKSYFYYLLQQRCRGYLFFAAAGMTAAARPAVVAGTAVLGFFAGTAAGMVILQCGVSGMGIFLAANLPQGMFYIPSMLMLLTEAYQKNGKIWKRSSGAVREYIVVLIFCLLGGLAGIVSETLVSPLFLSWLFARM